MAMSNSLHHAISAFSQTLKPGATKDHVEQHVRKLRHAETDGVAAYEDAAAEVLGELYGVYGAFTATGPEATSREFSDSASASEDSFSKKST